MTENNQKTYCLCKQIYDHSFMIECDNCKDWFHGRCIGEIEHCCSGIDKYHCPNCVLIVGKSILKKVTNNHRQNPWDPNASSKPIQSGTIAFIQQLNRFKYSDASEVIYFLKDGFILTNEFIRKNGFLRPIVVDKSDGLGMIMPPKGFGVDEILNIVSGDYILNVIDVNQQVDFKMPFKAFAKYFASNDRTNVFNVISFEFSDTPFSKYVTVPKLANNLDWATNYWKDNPSKVQKYCLMSAKDSYTDFHIDFGGTSVWYHVISGQKVFFLISPSDEHLSRFEQWMNSDESSEIFFATMVKKCFRLILNEGQTMFIPSGWIHAVYTPIDSIVIGGNFLHNFSIKMQLNIYDLENRLKTLDRFKYPNFETIHWYTAKKLYLYLKHENKKKVQCASFLLNSLCILFDKLNCWVDKSNPTHCESIAVIPREINYRKLLRNFNKQLEKQNIIKQHRVNKQTEESTN